MLNKRYRVFETCNEVAPLPDMARLEGLARRMCARTGAQDAQVGPIKQTLWRMYVDSNQRGGVCGGMVCEWAFNYLITGDADIPPSQRESALLQRDMEMTFFKRGMMDKEDANKAAQTRMYASRSLVLSTVERSQALPAQTMHYRATTEQIVNALTHATPHLLAVAPRGGRHAIGLLCHHQDYFVLEPEHGLFRFKQKQAMVNELNNHFVQVLPVRSVWKLKAIKL